MYSASVFAGVCSVSGVMPGLGCIVFIVILLLRVLVWSLLYPNAQFGSEPTRCRARLVLPHRLAHPTNGVRNASKLILWTHGP
jgi:hypothetical protein